MKYALLSVLFFTLSFGSTKAQITEDFSDGEIYSDPSWTGDTAFWKVENGVLRSNGPAISGSRIGLYTGNIYGPEAEWDIFVNLRLATSSNNYMDWILCSDSIPSGGSYHGYFVRLGGQKDNICLYRKEGSGMLLLFEGPGGMLAGTSDNPLRLLISRSADGIFSLGVQTDTNLHSLDSLGSCRDTAYPVFPHTGIEVSYSSSNYNRFFADNIYAGPVRRDTVPPAATGVKVLHPQEAVISFDEAVNTASFSAKMLDSEPGETGLTQIRQDTADPRKILFRPEKDFVSGNRYLLVLSSYSDASGNTRKGDTLSFSYYKAAYGDIIISEIMPDPSPAAGLPESEYIELMNVSDFPVELENWTIRDKSSQARLSDIRILPSQYLVLYPAASAPPVSHSAIAVSLPANFLNNAGDDLELLDASGRLIDRLSYSDKWYGTFVPEGGISLERKYPGTFCKDPSTNWTASKSAKGGTPGHENSVYQSTAVTSAPAIRRIEPKDSNMLLVLLTERPGKQMENILLYKVEGTAPETAFIKEDSLMLVFSEAFFPDPYSWKKLLIKSTYDCSGKELPGISDSFRYATAHIPGYKQVVFNEIMIRPEPPVALPASQYIELINRSGEALSLAGSYIRFRNQNHYLPPCIIYPGELLLILPENSGYSDTRNSVVMGKFPPLNTSAGELLLINSAGEITDAVSYQSSWYRDERKALGGWSLERGDTSVSCQDENTWKSSSDFRGGSPGTANAFDKSLEYKAPFPIHAYPLSPEKLKVYFSESMDADLENPLRWNMDGEIQVLSSKASGNTYREWEITLSEKMERGKTYLIRMSGASCSGEEIPEGKQEVKSGIPEAVAYGVINELLFNPYSGGTDFVEIINPGDNIVDLKNGWLATEKDQAISSAINIAPEGRLLFPGELLVFKARGAALELFYEVPFPEKVVELHPFPSLPDKEGIVLLLDSSGGILDRLAYSESWHFSLLKNKNGISLERIDPSVKGHAPENWASCASARGFATPSAPNSHYLSGKTASGEIWTASATFSPDGDGYEDLALFHYNFPIPGWMARVRIFSQAGVPVKDLGNISSLEKEGVFYWDGTNESGNVAGIGVYLAWIETFREDGTRKVYKLPVVLAGKL